MTDAVEASVGNGYRSPKLKHKDRRRVATAALVGVPVAAAALVLLSSWDAVPVLGKLDSTGLLRWTLVGIAVAFAAYALAREAGNRRLSSKLSDERVLAAAYSNRVRDLSALVSTARTINGVLDLDDVLRKLLDESLGFFQGDAGSIMLLDGAGFLQTVCARGNEGAEAARIRMGDSIAGHVALTREPLLLSGKANPRRFRHLVERDEPLESAMCVPLIHRNELLGVLNVSASPERLFGDHDLQLLTVFAGHAAIAIANARVFQAERERLSELAELNRMKSELIAGISQDLRAPLAALGGGVGALRRMGLAAPEASELLSGLQHHLDRLTRSVDRLLSEAELKADQRAEARGTADLAEVAATVAADFDRDGKPVEVRAEGACPVVGDEGLLQQVLWNLLDNAFKYGEPPVTIEVRTGDEQGILSVTDRGQGIAPGDRERIFQRFPRTGSGRGMGLGLSIVHAIVSASEGRVWADDAEGGGAVFHVALPTVPQQGQEHPAREVQAS